MSPISLRPRMPSSYRTRRRLGWLAAAVAVVVGAAVSATFFWNTAANIETFSGGEADIYVAPEPYQLTKVERAELVAVAQRFVETAVARNHPERAYEIVGQDLRGGLTKKDWETGDIPVIPYPVESARWKVEYSNSESIGLLVMVFPEKEAEFQPAVFSMKVVPVLRAGKNRWLVNGWVPKGGSPAAIASSKSSPREALGAAEDQLGRASRKASPAWLIVPLLLLSTVFVVPIVFLVRERRVSRRMRRYLDSRP